MSYGWAVLVIVVLAVILWNIGVFDSTTARHTSGFSVLRPIAWNFAGGNLSGSYVTIAIANIAGMDLRIGINGSDDAYTMRFKRYGGPNCGFINQSVDIQDRAGNSISLMEDTVRGVWTMDIPAGDMIVIKGTIVGANLSYICGGPSGSSFVYGIAYQYSLDQYNIQHSDSGTVTGDYG